MSTLEDDVFRILGEEDNSPAKTNKLARDRTILRQTTLDNSTGAANTRSSTATLHRFAKFPIEIRHTIYELSTSEPRVIEIAGYMHKNKSGKKEIRMRSNALVPAIMHACVDSRQSGMKLYKPLVVGKFLGTYVNWSYDYIMFKKTRSGKSIEDIFMTYEGRLPAEINHSDLVLNLERLAIHACHINDFVRVRSDPDGKIDASSPGLCLVYPKLKEVAIVELWSRCEKQTQNLTIRPKVRFGTVLPRMFCPHSPSEFSVNGKVRIVQNRWHQKVHWMRIVPGKHRPLVPANRRKPVVVPEQPVEPKRLPGISRYTLVDLRALCQERGIDDRGNRQVLIERIQNDEKCRYPRAVIQYKEDLRVWAGLMLGHTDGDWEKGVLAARADAVNKLLAERDLPHDREEIAQISESVQAASLDESFIPDHSFIFGLLTPFQG